MKLSVVFAKLTGGKAKVLGALLVGTALTSAVPAATAQVAFGVRIGGPRYYAPVPQPVYPAYGYGYVPPAYPTYRLGYGEGAPGYWERRRYEDWRAHEYWEHRDFDRWHDRDRDGWHR